ncbi:helix-turn-helix domain-containing protein [Kribbella sp.]|uniref:helix-turn-helix domain-containing protein n=1 Tax=Kribbella sp. TaxID=1871183 RepID=UPI002D5C883C|nr:helix-turn-helix domain-containing protein [Kribbella sp.]HZX03691.1 helix-turn-helix domain-containing protein [Kribbella sp.]
MLQGLGIDQQDEGVYVELLRRRRATADELGAAVDLPIAVVSDALTRLAGLGLVTGDDTGLHNAVPPDVGLGTLVVQHQSTLQQVQRRLTELVDVYRTGAASAMSEVEALTTPEELATWIDNIERGAKQELLAFFKPPYVLDADLEVTTDVPAYRYVYERSALEDPRTPAEIGRFLAGGYQIRLVNELPSKMIVMDRRIVLLPMLPDQTGVEPGFLLVRGPSLVRLLVDLFERVWQVATPLQLSATSLVEGGPAWDDFDIKLLTYLLSGMPDKSAAARLGTSERTVQRRIKRLMELSGTDSRMQLAWYAARSGLIAP